MPRDASQSLRDLNFKSGHYSNSLVSGIHAHVLTPNRRELWAEMKIISDLNKSWIAIGDFNCVLRNDEKKGGLPPRPCNNQVGGRRILCKLDRVLYNQLWLNNNGTWSYKALSRAKSDHSPIIGSTKSVPKPKNAPFRFQNMWIAHNKFLEVVSKSWTGFISGNPASRFAYKLKRLKDNLKQWNSAVFGNINTKISEMEARVKLAMNVLDEDPDDLEKLSHLLYLQREFDCIALQYDTFLN
ncbi:hypothetical protein BVC80_7499g4 [Macleaya cordata]|uniref:Endonuclease/exonuclease/phosphatase n=1 Tax=Macleaya cordata TaxID=56857 RepID=A0A200Q827_MACCD|nr:hypothetical protein BVC80_7499g4 [Macleaya cordata]